MIFLFSYQSIFPLHYITKAAEAIWKKRKKKTRKNAIKDFLNEM